MTWIAKRIASLPLGGLLLTWSTFRSIREGRARRVRLELDRVPTARIAELAAAAEQRQHPSRDQKSGGPASPSRDRGQVDHEST